METNENAKANIDISAYLKGVIPNIKEDELALLKSYCLIQSFEKNHILSYENDACQFLPFVIEGNIKVYKINDSAREIIFYNIKAFDSCIITMDCILNHAAFPAFAATSEQSLLLLIPVNAIDLILEKSTHFRNYLMRKAFHRISSIIYLVEDVIFERLDIRLLKLLEQAFDSEQNRVSMTHKEIADQLLASRESVSRMLKRFEKEGLLQIERSYIQIPQVATIQAAIQKRKLF